MEESRNTYRVLVRRLVRPRRRWKDHIMLDLRQVDCNGSNFLDLDQNGDPGLAYTKRVRKIRCLIFLHRKHVY